MRPESEHFTPTDDYPHPELWSARDEEASELEVGDFLYGFVRLLKPEIVLETGCYLGDTSRRIAQALHDNKRGELHTCDTVIDRVARTRTDLRYLPATVHHCSGEVLIEQFPEAELAFIDSNGDRNNEIARLRKCWVVLHDARWPNFSEYRNRGLFFQTPRGLAVFKVNQ